MGPTRFQRLATGVLGYNVLVIAWGAFVRASGSGAGCGAHWPLCNGQVIPREPTTELLVELSHRVTAGLTLVLGLWLVIQAFRTFPKGHPARGASSAAFGFVMGEALIGAGLVLFKLVAHDESMARALSMCLHLVNTFFLLGALTLTAWFASGAPRARLRGQGPVAPFVILPLVMMVVLGTSGAVAALGDTLFPAKSWAEGLAQDASPTAHALVHLRILHPMIAAITGVSVFAAAGTARLLRPTPHVKLASRAAMILVSAQLALGLLNLALLAPIPMQLAHLVMADAVWIALVVLAASALAVEADQSLSPSGPSIGSHGVEPARANFSTTD